jgi:hypothetical protein
MPIKQDFSSLSTIDSYVFPLLYDAITDTQGMIIPETVNRADPYEARVAIALSLERLAPLMPDNLVDSVFEFFVVKEALGDRNGAVRRAMLDAATAIIDLHGSKSVAELMKMFEDYLGRSGPSSETADYIKEAVVIVSISFKRRKDDGAWTLMSSCLVDLLDI